MKLLQISIHGFKSFADKITIDIKDGITGIVGPNGSGKSNIVDAVKWVLGEQSLKDIRGGNVTADVIFGGSKSRSASNRAWVSLKIDNSDHYLKSEQNELEIKRVIYNSGENEYYINNNQVRLKDITDLFIDSGSSVNSLSIISQGKIGEIINARPEDKRSIIEEAAGVLKYKKRKEETLRKLNKTNDNLSKINLIIDELFVNLEPLKEQSDAAKQYLEYKNQLSQTEISLLVYDIKETNNEYTTSKTQSESLNTEILSMDNLNLIDSSKIENLKNKLSKLEEKISTSSDELYKINGELNILTSEKQIMLERKKYEVEDQKLENNIIELKEKELRLKNNITSLKAEIKIKEQLLESKTSDNEKIISELKTLQLSKELSLKELNDFEKETLNLKNKIEIINDNLTNNNKLPYAVKSILSNVRLSGVHNVLGKLIQINEKYINAINIALGYNANVIIVDNENTATEAVKYLKNNNLGRATFFPLNIIKPKGIDTNTLFKIKNDPAYIGLASDLVSCDPIYRNIILNQLGNIIIVDNLNNANRIGKLINHMYRIITLDGDLISTGGSITGGSLKSDNNYLNEKYELDKYTKLLKEKELLHNDKLKNIDSIQDTITLTEHKVFDSNNDLNSIKEYLLRKYNELSVLENENTSVINEINGTNGILNNTIDKEIETILNKFYEVNTNKENLELKLNELKNNKNDLQSEINTLEINNKHVNSAYNKKVSELKEIEIKVGKLEVKLDNLLIRLSEEYSMTYEKASADYHLDEDESVARNKVNSLKHNIKILGDVNTGSIAEYDRINTRYTFLSEQKDDLNSSINDLLEIIKELDQTMEEKLTSTFKELNSEFANVFKKLFKGGEAELVLTNPDDILNSGLEIKAIPPGKEIHNTKLLSGGESTLTAISLLFAILNIRTVPFCILDEVEAALDDVNVDMFGTYLSGLNLKTQFIIITHKKRTMEYIDNLYGITMQESGISKLVSVKLN